VLRGSGLFDGAPATLNLDRSVAFLTPVLVYTARSRGESEAPLLFACVLLSNAASMFLPGSNLTNLIVLGHLHISGGEFFAHMWMPGTASVVITTLVIALFNRSHLRVSTDRVTPVDKPVVGLGLVAVVAATALVVALPSPAIPVVLIGISIVGVRFVSRNESWSRVAEVVGAPILIGLFGLAVALGTLGRVWSGPADFLAHLDSFGTAAMGAVCSVLLNNLPAASLLAARTPPRPYSLLIGLNLGPNLVVTGSLAWLLWLRSARSAGAQPSVRAAARIGVVAVPLSIGAAVAVLLLTGST
jgi:arsenical pump membrane protein